MSSTLTDAVTVKMHSGVCICAFANSEAFSMRIFIVGGDIGAELSWIVSVSLTSTCFMLWRVILNMQTLLGSAAINIGLKIVCVSFGVQNFKMYASAAKTIFS